MAAIHIEDKTMRTQMSRAIAAAAAVIALSIMGLQPAAGDFGEILKALADVVLHPAS